MKEYIKGHWQQLLNFYLFANFAGWGVWKTYEYAVQGSLGYVEISFTIQSLILAFVILLRKPHKSVNANLFHQAVALAAFMSGAGFMGQPVSGGDLSRTISEIIIFMANIIGIVTLLNLGRSFGILIAFRELKSSGLYGVVRHPMYGTDILLRIGFLASHMNPVTILLFIFSTSCYLYRAVLEERYLCGYPEYKAYMEKVRYRFIPFVF